MPYISDLLPLGRALLGTDQFLVNPVGTIQARVVDVDGFLAAMPAASDSTPLMDGVAAPGVLMTWARGDHKHGTDTTRAPLDSPTFTGTVTIPGGAAIAGYATTSSMTAAISAALAPYATTASVTSALAAMPLWTAMTTSLNQTLTVANSRTNYIASASVVLTLPVATSVPNGTTFGAIARGGTVTWVPDALASIGGGAVSASYVMPAGQSGMLVRDDTANWSLFFVSSAGSGGGDNLYQQGLTF